MSPPILNDEDLKARIPVLAKYVNEAEIVARNESSSKFEVVKALNRLTNYLAPMEKYSQVDAASPEVTQWYITAIHPTMFAANEVKSDLQSILQMIREAENKPQDAENTVLVTPQPHNEQTSKTDELINLLKDLLDLNETLRTLKSIKSMQKEIDLLKIERGYTFIGEVACKIIDGTETSRTFKENSPRTNKSQKRRDSRVPTPDISCEFIDAEDVSHHKAAPTCEEFQSFLINCRETRHGIHALKRRKVMDVKELGSVY